MVRSEQRRRDFMAGAEMMAEMCGCDTVSGDPEVLDSLEEMFLDYLTDHPDDEAADPGPIEF